MGVRYMAKVGSGNNYREEKEILYMQQEERRKAQQERAKEIKKKHQKEQEERVEKLKKQKEKYPTKSVDMSEFRPRDDGKFHLNDAKTIAVRLFILAIFIGIFLIIFGPLIFNFSGKVLGDYVIWTFIWGWRITKWFFIITVVGYILYKIVFWLMALFYWIFKRE